MDPKTDNMLKITGDGRKAALDMRLVDPVAEPQATPKSARAIEKILRDLGGNEGQALHAACLLRPLDAATPTGSTSMTKSATSSSRAASRPRKSPISTTPRPTRRRRRCLIPSMPGASASSWAPPRKWAPARTCRSGLIALHHLDAPWRPRDIEQREGRILRQGNENPEVHIHRYVTEGSFDAYMWQTLETKARFINQVMNGSVTVRQAEDLEGGALTYAEIKAIASGNPAVMEKVKVDTEIRKLDQLRSSHINQQYAIRRSIATFRRRLRGQRTALQRWRPTSRPATPIRRKRFR